MIPQWGLSALPTVVQSRGGGAFGLSVGWRGDYGAVIRDYANNVAMQAKKANKE